MFEGWRDEETERRRNGTEKTGVLVGFVSITSFSQTAAQPIPCIRLSAEISVISFGDSLSLILVDPQATLLLCNIHSKS